MKKERKTRDEYTLQGKYTGTWEDLTSEATRTEILKRRKDYRENEPGTALRIVKRRVKIMPPTLEEVLKAGNSNKNQDIKGQFIGQHVFCNINTLAEFVIKKGFEDSDAPFTIDDIDNFYTYPEHRGEYAAFDGGTKDQLDTEVERLRDMQSELYDQITDGNNEEIEGKREKIEEEITELENLETEGAEVFEWWAVSGFLHERLKQEGYPVVDAGSCHIWGRTTTGQAILLDGVITRICAEMEILEGQANSWARK